MVIGSGHNAAAVAGSSMPPLPSNVAARMTNPSLSSYYGAVAVYSSKLSRSRPVSAATTHKPSVTGSLHTASSWAYTMTARTMTARRYTMTATAMET